MNFICNFARVFNQVKMSERIGAFSSAVVWFGVAISVSEIEAGIQVGASNGGFELWAPLFIGHVVGGVLLFLVGLIGARLRQNAMQTTTEAFGVKGSKFFALLNLLQLLAWVAVLNAQGARALAGLDLPISFGWTCFLLSLFIAIWVFVGLRRTAKFAAIMVGVLTVLLLLLSVKWKIDDAYVVPVSSRSFGFWEIFEISIAMPISWLPVISDYTKDADRPVSTTASSAVAYTLASLWMYYIGVEIANLDANNDIARAILLAGLGVPGVFIVVLSTVTSNFLAANSAGESAKAVYFKLNPNIIGAVVCGFSAMLAASGIMDYYIDFLYLISSVFAPMAAVLIVAFYLPTKGKGGISFRIWNFVAWLLGFVAYEFTLHSGFFWGGPTLIAVVVSAAVAYMSRVMICMDRK